MFAAALPLGWYDAPHLATDAPHAAAAGDLWRKQRAARQPAEPSLQDQIKLAWIQAGLDWSPTALQVVPQLLADRPSALHSQDVSQLADQLIESGILSQMAMSDGRGSWGLGQQQEGGGFGQFFRGDLPKKLGTLLVSGSGGTPLLIDSQHVSN